MIERDVQDAVDANGMIAGMKRIKSTFLTESIGSFVFLIMWVIVAFTGIIDRSLAAALVAIYLGMLLVSFDAYYMTNAELAKWTED